MGAVVILPLEINVTDVHTVRSQSLASKLHVCIYNLLRWLYAQWRVASVSSDVPLSTAVLRAIDGV